MEVPKDVLPDSSPATPLEGEPKVEITPDVVVPPVPPVPPAPVVPPPVVQTPPAPGSQTPSENLLTVLQAERKRVKELEDEVSLLKGTSTPPVSEAFSDEGKMLETKIHSLESELVSLREEKVLEAIQIQYPVLKDLSVEFSQYKVGFPGVEIEKVVKLFLNEKGLLDTPRKGLERSTSGGQPPVSDKLTAEEVADLRKNNHRKYTEYLMNGKIRLDELS